MLFLCIGPVRELRAASPIVRQAASRTDPEIQIIRRVADWQWSQSSWGSGNNWHHGALFTGVMATHEATKDSAYGKGAIDWAEDFNWQLFGPDNTRHADHHACAQTYLELYMIGSADPIRTADATAINSFIADNPALFNCTNHSSSYWWWCDALFMQPPVLARLTRITGDQKYINLMHNMWADTQNCLYNGAWDLFYRDSDYLDDLSPNGLPVFWSRGNGWVMGGIVRVLQYLPLSDPQRPAYIQLFKDMAARIKATQRNDGYWGTNLLDPDEYPNPETSGTGFFCYALAWGINQGHLSESEYGPTVDKAWRALQMAVHSDGRLGFVQPVGKDPQPATQTSTEVFGVGAFLLAGSEVRKRRMAASAGFIDNFERYNSSAALPLSSAWSVVNAATASISLGDHGDRFMKLAYNTSVGSGEAAARRNYTSDQNWTVTDLRWLAFTVRGFPTNAAARLFVELQDANNLTARQTLTTTADVRSSTTLEVSFDLTAFSGINLARVRSIRLGVVPAGVGPTGTGTIWIDEIQRTVSPADFQAEEAVLTGAMPALPTRNYHGTTFVVFPSAGQIVWNRIPALPAGNFRVQIRYANGLSAATGQVRVNGGTPQTVSFPSTGPSPNVYSSVSFNVALAQAENNSIELSFASQANVQIDEMSLQRIAADTTPPAVPAGLTGSSSTHTLNLVWQANSESDLAGYHVYLSTISSGVGVRLTSAPTASPSFTFPAVSVDTTYYISISAVDTSGNESARTTPLAHAPPSTIIANLCLNRPVVVSSEPEAANPGANAVDGNTGSRWSASPFPQWIEIDLQNIYSIDRTELVAYQNRAYRFIIEAKTTAGGTYQTIVNRSNNTTPGTISAPIRDDIAPVMARYLRLTCTSAFNYTGNFVSLLEVRAFDSSPPAVPPGLNTIGSFSRTVKLNWTPNTEADWIGYRIYRALGRLPNNQDPPINSSLHLAPSYTQGPIAQNGTYYYAVTAVDRLGNESAKSAAVSVTIPQSNAADPSWLGQ